jgi:integrase
LSDIGVSQRVCKLAQKAGVRLSFHTLRKGFGCRYAGRVPAQVLQKLMRHASVKTTMDYYANVDDAVVEAVLGIQRNSSRNNGNSVAMDAPPPEAVIPYSAGTNDSPTEYPPHP